MRLSPKHLAASNPENPHFSFEEPDHESSEAEVQRMAKALKYHEVYSRSGDVWVYRAYGSGEVVHLAGIEIPLSMDPVYEDVASDLREE